MRAWFVEHLRGWDDALTQLRGEGWSASLTCPAAPVQIEGRLPSGELFYFRARHEHVALAVGGDDPSSWAPWESEVPYGTAEEASYLPAADGLALIHDLYARFRES